VNVSSFSFSSSLLKRSSSLLSTSTSTSILSMNYNNNNNNNNNNDIKSLKTIVSSSLSSSLSSLNRLFLTAATTAAITTITTTTNANPAIAGALDDCNTKLSNFGLPPIVFVPPGFTPLVGVIGRGSAKEAMSNPVVVQFAHPGLWVEATTTINNNGEAGTISANDYIKGDSAFFYTLPSSEKVSLDNKALIQKFILKSLTQKGDALDSFKVDKIQQGTKGINGQEYIIADISYTLNTEAGFSIDRKGFVSLTSVGNYIQGLVCVTTKLRYTGKKELCVTLRDIADSFRVYKLDSGVFSGV
jgi:hypothetical protein